MRPPTPDCVVFPLLLLVPFLLLVQSLGAQTTWVVDTQ